MLQHHRRAGVALLAKAKRLRARRPSCWLAPVRWAMRAAAMLHIEGAEVAITSRQARTRAGFPPPRFRSVSVFTPTAIEAVDNAARANAVKGAQIVFAAGAIGVPLLDEKDWQNDATIELLADCNAQPPLGAWRRRGTDKARSVMARSSSARWGSAV